MKHCNHADFYFEKEAWVQVVEIFECQTTELNFGWTQGTTDAYKQNCKSLIG